MEGTLPYKKYGNESTNRINLEMVLTRRAQINLAFTRVMFPMYAGLFVVMLRIVFRSICSIFIRKIERERELLIKDLTWYQKLQEIGYKLGEIASNVVFTMQAAYIVFRNCQ